MDETTVSKELAGATVINLNLPDWSSATQTATAQPLVDPIAQKRRNQLYIGVAILTVLIIAAVAIRKPKS